MKPFQLLSRRKVDANRKVDFRPDPNEGTPNAQLRRLARVLRQDDIAAAEDLEDVDDAVDAWREFTYRKIFSGTTHDEFMALDHKDPQRIDWLIAVAGVDNDVYRGKKDNGNRSAAQR